MRKIKKINGFLVVKFNDREKREYEGTALGEYGVIDAEVYTGNLDIDRGAMEYDDADTLEVAVELARGLESEEDITDEPPTYTAAVETNESYTEEAVEPAALIEGWTRRLATQVKSKHYPDTDPRTAAHELYGFKMALRQIGFLPESEVITDPDTFGAGRLDGPMPRNPEELLAFVCDERCKNRAGHTQEELDAICAKCPLGQLYEDAEAQDLRIRERSERALREHIEGVRHAEDTVTALLGGHEALAYLAALRDGQKIRNLLPFSDAKEGPLSTLTLSGQRTMTTYAHGLTLAGDAPAEAMNKSLQQVQGALDRKPEKKVDLGGGKKDKDESSDEGGSGKGKQVIIHKLLVPVDLKKIKDLQQLLALLQEVEDYAAANEDGEPGDDEDAVPALA